MSHIRLFETFKCVKNVVVSERTIAVQRDDDEKQKKKATASG